MKVCAPLFNTHVPMFSRKNESKVFSCSVFNGYKKDCVSLFVVNEIVNHCCQCVKIAAVNACIP